MLAVANLATVKESHAGARSVEETAKALLRQILLAQGMIGWPPQRYAYSWSGLCDCFWQYSASSRMMSSGCASNRVFLGSFVLVDHLHVLALEHSNWPSPARC
jgi:hypothetical protein